MKGEMRRNQSTGLAEEWDQIRTREGNKRKDSL
jgi:hypothetical protein